MGAKENGQPTMMLPILKERSVSLSNFRLGLWDDQDRNCSGGAELTGSTNGFFQNAKKKKKKINGFAFFQRFN